MPSPPFPFVNKSFEIDVYLMDGDQIKCGEEIPLIVELFLENSSTPYDGLDVTAKLEILSTDQYELQSGAPSIGRNGMTTLQLMIKNTSMSFENRKIIISTRVHSSSILGESTLKRLLRDTSPAVSRGLFCVRYRLKVHVDMRDNPTPEIWFKDEGGRENRIDLHVDLENSDGSKVSHRKVPLKIVLIYGNGEIVLKQDILSIAPESKLFIDESGSTVLRLRINDVSKNHQRQLFSVLVSPDTASSPLLNDISSDASNPLEVKSKRSKRHRESSTAGGSGNEADMNTGGLWPPLHFLNDSTPSYQFLTML